MVLSVSGYTVPVPLYMTLKKKFGHNKKKIASSRFSVSSHTVYSVISLTFNCFPSLVPVNATNNPQTAFSKAVPKLKLGSTSFTLVLLSKVHVRTYPHARLVPRAINQSGPHLGLKGVLGKKASPSEQRSNGSLGGSFYLHTSLLYGAQLFDLKIPSLMRSLLNN